MLHKLFTACRQFAVDLLCRPSRLVLLLSGGFIFLTCVLHIAFRWSLRRKLRPNGMMQRPAHGTGAALLQPGSQDACLFRKEGTVQRHIPLVKFRCPVAYLPIAFIGLSQFSLQRVNALPQHGKGIEAVHGFLGSANLRRGMLHLRRRPRQVRRLSLVLRQHLLKPLRFHLKPRLFRHKPGCFARCISSAAAAVLQLVILGQRRTDSGSLLIHGFRLRYLILRLAENVQSAGQFSCCLRQFLPRL